MNDLNEYILALQRANAASVGEFSLEDIIDGLSVGAYQGWNVDGLFAVTVINDYPQKRICVIQLCGGTMTKEALEKGLLLIESFAKENGCTDLQLQGRKGWVKVLSQYGFAEQYVVLNKSLGG